MLEQTQDSQEIIERVAALDIGKAVLTCCLRVPDGAGGGRVQEVTEYSTMTRSLQLMADRLLELGVMRVVVEATSDYWKPPFYLLEAHGLEVWLVNAKDVKHLPGRPKTNRLDAVWLCKIADRRTADDPAQLRAAATDPPLAGPDPLSGGADRGPHPGEEPGREAARRRPDQVVGRRVGHLWRFGPGGDGPARRG